MPATPDEPGRALAALESEVLCLDPALQQPLLRVPHPQPGPRHPQLVLVRPEHCLHPTQHHNLPGEQIFLMSYKYF